LYTTAPEKRAIEIALCLALIAISIVIDCGQNIRFLIVSMIDPTLDACTGFLR